MNLHMKRRTLLLAPLTTISGCRESSLPPVTLGTKPYVKRVPFSTLIARPNDFSGKQVAVIGVASWGVERTALFASEFDFIHTVLPNSLWLDVDGKLLHEMRAVHGRVVEVAATYALPDESMRSGSLRDVESIATWSGSEAKRRRRELPRY